MLYISFICVQSACFQFWSPQDPHLYTAFKCDTLQGKYKEHLACFHMLYLNHVSVCCVGFSLIL